MNSEIAQRVENELKELTVKLNALNSFIGSPVFESLTEREKDLLCGQSNHMTGYRNVLAQRVPMLWSKVK